MAVGAFLCGIRWVWCIVGVGVGVGAGAVYGTVFLIGVQYPGGVRNWGVFGCFGCGCIFGVLVAFFCVRFGGRWL